MKELMFNICEKLVDIFIELDLTDMNFMLHDRDDPDDYINMIAYVTSDGIKAKHVKSVGVMKYRGNSFISIPSTAKFSIRYKTEITIVESALTLYCDDIMHALDIQHEKLNRLIKAAVLENIIIHELRHLYQFRTSKFKRNNFTAILGRNSYAFVFTDATRDKLEADANHYMMDNITTTTVEDFLLKFIISNLQYNTVYENPEQVKKWFKRLERHVDRHYVSK